MLNLKKTIKTIFCLLVITFSTQAAEEKKLNPAATSFTPLARYQPASARLIPLVNDGIVSTMQPNGTIPIPQTKVALDPSMGRPSIAQTVTTINQKKGKLFGFCTTKNRVGPLTAFNPEQLPDNKAAFYFYHQPSPDAPLSIVTSTQFVLEMCKKYKININQFANNMTIAYEPALQVFAQNFSQSSLFNNILKQKVLAPYIQQQPIPYPQQYSRIPYPYILPHGQQMPPPGAAMQPATQQQGSGENLLSASHESAQSKRITELEARLLKAEKLLQEKEAPKKAEQPKIQKEEFAQKRKKTAELNKASQGVSPQEKEKEERFKKQQQKKAKAARQKTKIAERQDAQKKQSKQKIESGTLTQQVQAQEKKKNEARQKTEEEQPKKILEEKKHNPTNTQQKPEKKKKKKGKKPLTPEQEAQREKDRAAARLLLEQQETAKKEKLEQAEKKRLANGKIQKEKAAAKKAAKEATAVKLRKEKEETKKYLQQAQQQAEQERIIQKQTKLTEKKDEEKEEKEKHKKELHAALRKKIKSGCKQDQAEKKSAAKELEQEAIELLKSNKYFEAAQAFAKAAEIFPDSKEHLMNLAVCFRNNNQPKEAEEILLKIDPEQLEKKLRKNLLDERRLLLSLVPTNVIINGLSFEERTEKLAQIYDKFGQSLFADSVRASSLHRQYTCTNGTAHYNSSSCHCKKIRNLLEKHSFKELFPLCRYILAEKWLIGAGGKKREEEAVAVLKEMSEDVNKYRPACVTLGNHLINSKNEAVRNCESGFQMLLKAQTHQGYFCYVCNGLTTPGNKFQHLIPTVNFITINYSSYSLEEQRLIVEAAFEFLEKNINTFEQYYTKDSLTNNEEHSITAALTVASMVRNNSWKLKVFHPQCDASLQKITKIEQKLRKRFKDIPELPSFYTPSFTELKGDETQEKLFQCFEGIDVLHPSATSQMEKLLTAATKHDYKDLLCKIGSTTRILISKNINCKKNTELAQQCYEYLVDKEPTNQEYLMPLIVVLRIQNENGEKTEDMIRLCDTALKNELNESSHLAIHSILADLHLESKHPKTQTVACGEGQECRHASASQLLEPFLEMKSIKEYPAVVIAIGKMFFESPDCPHVKQARTIMQLFEDVDLSFHPDAPAMLGQLYIKVAESENEQEKENYRDTGIVFLEKAVRDGSTMAMQGLTNIRLQKFKKEPTTETLEKICHTWSLLRQSNSNTCDEEEQLEQMVIQENDGELLRKIADFLISEADKLCDLNSKQGNLFIDCLSSLVPILKRKLPLDSYFNNIELAMHAYKKATHEYPHREDLAKTQNGLIQIAVLLGKVATPCWPNEADDTLAYGGITEPPVLSDSARFYCEVTEKEKCHAGLSSLSDDKLLEFVRCTLFLNPLRNPLNFNKVAEVIEKIKNENTKATATELCARLLPYYVNEFVTKNTENPSVTTLASLGALIESFDQNYAQLKRELLMTLKEFACNYSKSVVLKKNRSFLNEAFCLATVQTLLGKENRIGYFKRIASSTPHGDKDLHISPILLCSEKDENFLSYSDIFTAGQVLRSITKPADSLSEEEYLLLQTITHKSYYMAKLTQSYHSLLGQISKMICQKIENKNSENDESIPMIIVTFRDLLCSSISTTNSNLTAEQVVSLVSTVTTSLVQSQYDIYAQRIGDEVLFALNERSQNETQGLQPASSLKMTWQQAHTHIQELFSKNSMPKNPTKKTFMVLYNPNNENETRKMTTLLALMEFNDENNLQEQEQAFSTLQKNQDILMEIIMNDEEDTKKEIETCTSLLLNLIQALPALNKSNQKKAKDHLISQVEKITKQLIDESKEDILENIKEKVKHFPKFKKRLDEVLKSYH